MTKKRLDSDVWDELYNDGGDTFSVGNGGYLNLEIIASFNGYKMATNHMCDEDHNSHDTAIICSHRAAEIATAMRRCIKFLRAMNNTGRRFYPHLSDVLGCTTRWLDDDQLQIPHANLMIMRQELQCYDELPDRIFEGEFSTYFHWHHCTEAWIEYFERFVRFAEAGAFCITANDE
jgi:hypothetical protein